VPAYLVASSVIAIQAQRLVRRLCSCKTVQPDGSAQAKGCDLCRSSGFKGRLAIYELMRLTPRVRSVVVARGSEDLVRRAARATGMRTMYMDGALKAARGVTALDEVLRVVPPDDVDDSEQPEAETPGRATPAPIPAALSGEVRKLRRHKIMIVEDDAALLEVLRDLLVSEEYEVVTALDGRAARALIYRESPDLILSDIYMPEMDGLELLEKIRNDLATRHVPVVFLTGADGIDTQAQAYDLGADGFVTKPVHEKLLLSTIRRSLYRAHLLRS
jgi:CheY-like chemotaxis protein